MIGVAAPGIDPDDPVSGGTPERFVRQEWI
jgi:hypothetical protein